MMFVLNYALFIVVKEKKMKTVVWSLAKQKEKIKLS